MFEDDDDLLCDSPYVNGHWEWDTTDEELKFMSDLASAEEEYEISTTNISNVKFKDDIDLWEQQKFKKRMQRKTSENDVVMLQCPKTFGSETWLTTGLIRRLRVTQDAMKSAILRVVSLRDPSGMRRSVEDPELPT
ncbi:jg19214 [Pararge aegeria aegeria]|uniref:Jg19214 protein n=1 Tax=Pararge aegeria aegeria TaxID=348720 RepID=A0A8S4SI55_9NEOP|nr:jg19214 [Pararge aegeria aegeria]